MDNMTEDEKQRLLDSSKFIQAMQETYKYVVINTVANTSMSYLLDPRVMYELVDQLSKSGFVITQVDDVEHNHFDVRSSFEVIQIQRPTGRYMYSAADLKSMGQAKFKSAIS